MSEEEEDYDELPPISVNSSTRESSFSMPCASELATQRAREQQCELEIRRLREDHAQETEGVVSRIAHSDSSGSEGEAALAAAVTALRVRAGAGAGAGGGARAAALLAALVPLLPPAPFLAEYLSAARAAPARILDALDDDIVQDISGAVSAAAAGEPWEGAEAAAAGAWLCSALAARAARRRPALTRAAHLLLDEVAGAGAAAALLAALARAGAPWVARARLDLADALRSGGARCEAVADALVRAALAGLPPAAWRQLDADAQYCALQLAGRARAHTAPAVEECPLEALLTLAAPSAKDHRPDTLKVLVAASKLQVLFHVKK